MNNGECELCPVGAWNGDVDQNSCTNCTAGTTTVNPGADTGALCGMF